MSDTLPPIVHFDFDGTLVRLAEKKNSWQNFTKEGLEPVEHAADFIAGISSTEVEIGNVVSRRPGIEQRLAATEASVAEAGLAKYFKDRSRLSLEGIILPWSLSETLKALRVIQDADRSDGAGRVTGMVEDKPDNLGLEMVRLMAQLGHNYRPIVLGVVDRPDAEKRVSKLVNGVISEFDTAVTVSELDRGFQISSQGAGGSFILDVVMLEPFSLVTGVGFGKHLNSRVSN